jgi:FdhE protein
MTKAAWLAKHPYLHGIADLHELIDSTTAEVAVPVATVPAWDDYVGDFGAGVPLLLSPMVMIDLRPVENVFVPLVAALATKPLPEKLAHETRALAVELQSDPSLPCRALGWLLGEDTFTPSYPGLLRYLGWTVMNRYLGQLVSAFAKWREEECWLRNYCPTCGATPAMAQLAGSDPGRLRLLSCGCCATRWRYRRTGCPFCDADDAQRLDVLAIEGETSLRIEYCQACGGYLKTYCGEGSEEVLLADWTSLHLDFVAQDRGLRRFAGSLYQL